MKKQNSTYIHWLSDIKGRIRSTQIKAGIAVNSALIEFYWELGKDINEKENAWGSKLIDNLAKDLKAEFPDLKGLSASNIKYCKRFYDFYAKIGQDYDNKLENDKSVIGQQPLDQLENHQSVIGQQPLDQLENDKSVIGQQPLDQLENDQSVIGQQHVDQLQNIDNEIVAYLKKLLFGIPWGHNIYIFTKSKNTNEAIFYAQKTIENNWSRDVLDMQIKSNLYLRQGRSVNNFKHTLPEPLSDLATQTLKDPYICDFLMLSEGFKERDIELQLIQHITKFLLELGKGFAFIGRQYHLMVADSAYYIDLLFYHTKLKCYVVIELKNTKFIPEYTGKLNFYLSAVDSLIKDTSDNPTIGILLCRYKNNLEAEFALRDINKPIGISDLEFLQHLPENLKSSLPTIEEIEEELNKLDI